MADKVIKKSQWEREDDYNPGHDFSNSIQEKWIHKQVVVRTGDGEDDWIIDEKPVKIDEIDLHKSINEEAKTTDLKYLLKQLLLTGDESILNQRPGFYGDITAIQAGLEGQVMPSAQQIKESLPEELKKLSVEQLATMSDEDIVAYFKKVREETVESSDAVVKETVQDTVQETVQKEE